MVDLTFWHNESALDTPSASCKYFIKKKPFPALNSGLTPHEIGTRLLININHSAFTGENVMNQKSRKWIPLLTLCSALCLANSSWAQALYWDNNDATAGFGTASGTWAAPTTNDATQGWSTNSLGTDALSGTTTTATNSSLNFGTTANGLAAGTITVSGNVSSGAMTFGSASGNITLSGGSITLGGNINMSAGSAAIHTISSDITLTNGARTIGANNVVNQFVLNGVISGTTSLTYVSSDGGRISLNNTNTFTGDFANSRGQVSFNSIANKGQNSSLGAGTNITAGLNGAQNLKFWYTGADSASSDRTWNIAGGTSYIAQDGSMRLTGDLTSGTAFNMTINFAGTANTGTNEISGRIFDAAGANVINVAVNNTAPTAGSNEAGFWILSGSNSYEGTTTVANNSTLRIAHANALGTTAAGTTVQNGSVLELAGGIAVGAEALSLQGTGISLGGALRNISGDNSYAGTIALAAAARISSDAGTMTLANITNSQNLTFGGAGNTTVSGDITTGTGTLTKIGDGTLTLAGANTFTGATVVSAGSMIVNGSTAAGSVLTVESSATLGGSGTIGGATTISGIHSPGNSPGIQTFSSNLTYAGTPTVQWELTANTTTQGDPTRVFDQIIVGGNLDFSVPTTLTLNFALPGSTVDWSDGLWDSDITGASGWLVYDVAGTLSNFENLSISVENWADGSGDLFDTVRAGSSFSLYNDGISSDVYLNYAVPEPSTYALLVLAAAGLGTHVVRRRRNR